MEGVVCAITLTTTIARLKPYLSEAVLIERWLGTFPLPHSNSMLNGEVVTDRRTVTIQPLEDSKIETEYWVNERRQLYVISLPPPAPRPTYFLEFQRIPNGVHLLFTAHLPDDIPNETIAEQKGVMNQALEALKHLVEESSVLR
jgi:hypothetical protein